MIHIAWISADGFREVRESVCQDGFAHKIRSCGEIGISRNIDPAGRIDGDVVVDARTLSARSRRRSDVEVKTRSVSTASRLLTVDDNMIGLT